MVRICLLFLSIVFLAQPVLAQKAGVGAWENSQNLTLNWIERVQGLTWYYNWRPDQMWHAEMQTRSVEFVPMIHNADDVHKTIISDQPVYHLLAFNEPDGSGDHQADLSVEEAIGLWPLLERRKLRLSSPAVTQHQTLGPHSWLARFMAEVDKRGLRVDFMAVHYYSKNGNVEAFRNWLKRVYDEYKRPIWVTEFAYIDWDRPMEVGYYENARFLQQATRMMEELHFVERHAWFSANPYIWRGRAPRINIIDDQLRLTPVGDAFESTLKTLVDRELGS